MKRSFIFFHILFWLINFKSLAQFSWVEIGVDGLTCSQCSRSVEMEIRKLDFVQDVQMDLEHTHGKITFKDGAAVYIEKIARAVKDAGFSVRYLKADFLFSNTAVDDGYCLQFGNRSYQFVKTAAQSLKGEAQIKFIGKDFLPKSEYKTWQPQLKPKCSDKEKHFYVTLA